MRVETTNNSAHGYANFTAVGTAGLDMTGILSTCQVEKTNLNALKCISVYTATQKHEKDGKTKMCHTCSKH